MARSTRSDSTASDATIDGKHPARYSDVVAPAQGDDTADGAKLSWDDEERVGLIDGRDSSDATLKPTTRISRYARGKVTRLFVIKVFAFLVLIPAAFLVFFALLFWLSSPSHTSLPYDELLIQGPLRTTEFRPAQNYTKYAAAANNAKGSCGLGNSPSIAFIENVSGWSTPKEADQALELPPGTTKATLERQGYKQLRPVTMDVIFNNTFGSRRSSLRWSAEDKDDGVFMTVQGMQQDIVFEDVTHARRERTGKGQIAPGGGKVTYVRGADVKDERGNRIDWTDFKPSPDLSHVLFMADTKSVWRYSNLFNVWVFDLQRNQTVPLDGAPSFPPVISNVAWIPNTSRGLVYVKKNDLYVTFDPSGRSSHRITSDGSETVFNGAADWVYEEEVLATDHAIYISPDGTKLAWLRFDETTVPVYKFPIYNSEPKSGQTRPYLDDVRMKYPKPGYDNPTVSAHMIDLTELERTGKADIVELVPPHSQQISSAHPEAARVDTELSSSSGRKNRIITDVKWLDDSHILITETNRVADKMRTVLFDTSKSPDANKLQGQALRHRDVGSKSWIVPSQSLTPLYSRQKATTAYVDVVPDPRGFKHIAFFSDARATEPTFLTTGDWEVASLLHVDSKRGKAYFSAANPAHYRRHVFSVDLPLDGDAADKIVATSQPTDLVGSGHSTQSFDADFDPKGAYYVLKETGPGIPTAKVVGVDDKDFEWVIEDNSQARNITAQFVRSQSVYYNVTVRDAETGADVITTVQEIRPHDFDSNVRYPVLLNVYGGPEAQQVKHSYGRQSWHEHLANHLGYVVAIVDGRGTGFKGANYSNVMAQQLGRYEIQDLLATAKELRSLAYVDESRIGLWGWSYGGYFTLKALEANAGVLSLGMAVAPVAKWEFYDSVYTERYMKLPTAEQNSAGYVNSSVHVTDGFKNAKLLLAHGTGDDNVHFESSAHLLDLLTAAQVRNFWFRAFPDSTHAISTRGAYRELHEWMTEFLKMQWGAGGKRRFIDPTGSSTRKNLVDKHSRRDARSQAETQRINRQQRDIEPIQKASTRRRHRG